VVIVRMNRDRPCCLYQLEIISENKRKKENMKPFDPIKSFPAI